MTGAAAPCAAGRATAWHHRGFRLLLAGQCASLSGTAVSTVAVPALAVLDLHATASQAAALVFVGQLPNFLFALPAGALCDRRLRRPLMIAGDLSAAVVLVSIPVASVLGSLTIGHVYVVLFLLGVAKNLHDGAVISYLPGLVGPRLVQSANSRIGGAFSVADSAGNNAGAVLVGALGAARSLLADVLSYLVSAWCIWHINTPEPPPRPARRRLTAEIAEGLRYVAQHSTIRSLIAALSLLSFALGIVNTYWVYYLLSTLHWSPTALGVVMGAGGAGSLAGALLAPRIGERIGPGPLVIAGFALTPLTELPLLLAHPGRGGQVALAAALVVQLFSAAAAGTTQRSLRQVLCEPGLQARQQAASTWLTAGSRPLAALLAWTLATAFSVRAALAAGTLLMLAPVAVLVCSPVRELRVFPSVPAPRPAQQDGARP
ncbi:MFS transporter [Streptomyces sp. NPDC059928]|uniref:MFS transporter n=1 Tax=unclassified Streptomyces TaxID=2593676 RepID=UPI00365F3C6D